MFLLPEKTKLLQTTLLFSGILLLVFTATAAILILYRALQREKKRNGENELRCLEQFNYILELQGDMYVKDMFRKEDLGLLIDHLYTMSLLVDDNMLKEHARQRYDEVLMQVYENLHKQARSLAVQMSLHQWEQEGLAITIEHYFDIVNKEQLRPVLYKLELENIPFFKDPKFTLYLFNLLQYSVLFLQSLDSAERFIHISLGPDGCRLSLSGVSVLGKNINNQALRSLELAVKSAAGRISIQEGELIFEIPLLSAKQLKKEIAT